MIPPSIPSTIISLIPYIKIMTAPIYNITNNFTIPKSAHSIQYSPSNAIKQNAVFDDYNLTPPGFPTNTHDNISTFDDDNHHSLGTFDSTSYHQPSEDDEEHFTFDDNNPFTLSPYPSIDGDNQNYESKEI